MKHLSKDAYIKNGSALVLALSSEAREKKEKGIKVIDATIGILLDDNGNLSSFNFVNKSLKDSVNLNNRKYTSVKGNKQFNTTLTNWLFKDSKSLASKYKHDVCATIGGAGALMIAIRNYVDEKKEILIPDIGWGNYVATAELLNRKVLKYPLFLNNKLDLQGIKETVIKSAKINNKLTIIINDPCHNPSGYSFSKNEWIELIKFFNEVNKKYPLTLILDAAYMDYSSNSRIYFKLIDKIKAQYLTLVAFSASKTLSIYGMRLGALVAIGNKEDIEDFNLATTASSRATWGSPNGHVIAAFNASLSDKKNYPLFNKYKEKHHKLLEERYKKARKYFDKLIIGGTPLPYKEGFFLTYKVKNANKLAESLKKKNIYVLPMQDNYIRIAICSLTNL